jgi:HK97 family phage major capsid protein
MTEFAEIVRLDNELAAKQKSLNEYLESAKDPATKGYAPEKMLKDASGASLSAVAFAEECQKRNAELNEIGVKKTTLQGVYQVEQDQKKRDDAAKARGGADPHPGNGDQGTMEQKGRALVKTFGELFIEHPIFKENHKKRSRQAWGFELEDIELKTLFETGAGWAPQNLRTGKVVEIAQRPIQLIDTMPMDTTDQGAIVYMEETTQTLSNVVEKAEGAAYGEVTFVLTQRTVPVENLPAFVPVTDQQLEDVPQAGPWLDRKMRYALMQRLDYQLVNGTGVTPLLVGVTAASNLQTQARGSDPVPDAIMKGMTKVRVTGRGIPSAVWMNPTDIQNLMLLRTAEGVYIWGKPSEAGPKFVWGVPMAETDSTAQGTSIVGDFANFSRIVTRKGIDVEVGYNGDDFKSGKKTVRANMRVAIVWERGAAFCTVTGLPA